jgi:hypothetical protein
MISESWYWKQPLLEAADRFEALKSTGELSDEQLAEIEREIFIGFYSVRKLFESVAKITDATKAMEIQVEWHPNREAVTWRNNHKISELYDLTVSNQETRALRFICGRIIHSFVFSPSFEEDGGLAGIFFTSDLDKDKKLYFLSINQVIKIFQRVGNDDPANIEWSTDPKTGKKALVVE